MIPVADTFKIFSSLARMQMSRGMCLHKFVPQCTPLHVHCTSLQDMLSHCGQTTYAQLLQAPGRLLQPESMCCGKLRGAQAAPELKHSVPQAAAHGDRGVGSSTSLSVSSHAGVQCASRLAGPWAACSLISAFVLAHAILACFVQFFFSRLRGVCVCGGGG